MTNCFKKHWFLIIGILLLSNYSIGQSFISTPDGLDKPNGRPFIVRLNPTSSIAAQCTSQTITLNIKQLTYLPGSNGPLPAGVTITPVTDNTGNTVLTIEGIVNDGKQGSSLTMDIALQFKPGTCDGDEQVISATTKNIGCAVDSDQAGSLTVRSLTLNNAYVSMYLNSPSLTQPICPRKTIKYTIDITNYGNQGFNLDKLKLRLELDKCATVLGVYKTGTYVPVNTVESNEGNLKIVTVDVPDLLLSINYVNAGFDVYFMYPCLNGNANDCSGGTKSISATLSGSKKGCGVTFELNKVAASHITTISPATCGDVNCSTGGSVGELEGIYISSLYTSFPCSNACLGSSQYAGMGLYIPPFHPDFQDRVATIDVPAGINIQYAFAGSATACGTYYTVMYVDAQGNKQSYPFGNSLTRKIELSTTCSISSPVTYFYVYFDYDLINPPLAGSSLNFNFRYTSQGVKVIESTFGGTIQPCNPRAYLVKQVRKASQQVYENNYNASAIPGELMTYRQMIYNDGTGDTNNIIIDNINENLIYEGGVRYAYEPTSYIYDPELFTPLEGRDSFEIAGLGKVNVSVPKIGQSGGIVKLSGFNFPCTNKRLFVEFNVRVKNNVSAGALIPNYATISGSQPRYDTPSIPYITIAAFTYVKTKMFVKCSLANEWNDSGINVKNGEVVDFKMQFTNAGSNPIVLSELLNLRPQPGDLFEFGSNSRNSTLNINYNCDTPTAFLNGEKTSSLTFNYALNSPTMDRDMLCPPRSSGNVPNWIPSCDSSNWLKATFSNNFTLLPGDYVDVVYKGRITGTIGKAYNSFAFKVGNCNIVSANSNTLAITNDEVGVGCNSCTLTNPYSGDMKNLFESLMNNVLTRKIKGETDAQINGSSPVELLALIPYMTNGGGDKIYNFVSVKNAQGKITSIKFSFSSNSENDVTFIEEKGVDYNPEVGSVDPSYLKIDTTLYSAADQYLTSCRRTFDDNGGVLFECNSKTQVRHIDFCPTRFCYPMGGEIKTGE